MRNGLKRTTLLAVGLSCYMSKATISSYDWLDFNICMIFVGEHNVCVIVDYIDN